jgi:hypothetical protein
MFPKLTLTPSLTSLSGALHRLWKVFDPRQKAPGVRRDVVRVHTSSLTIGVIIDTHHCRTGQGSDYTSLYYSTGLIAANLDLNFLKRSLLHWPRQFPVTTRHFDKAEHNIEHL